MARFADGRALLWLAIFLAWVGLAGCAGAPPWVGSWREIGRTATLELFEDGTFRAVDNEGISVGGRYQALGKNRMRFDLHVPEKAPEPLVLNLAVQGEVLMIWDQDSEKAERYERVR